MLASLLSEIAINDFNLQLHQEMKETALVWIMHVVSAVNGDVECENISRNQMEMEI